MAEVCLFSWLLPGDGLDLAVRKYAKAAETSSVSELDEVYHEGERIKKLTVAGCDILRIYCCLSRGGLQ